MTQRSLMILSARSMTPDVDDGFKVTRKLSVLLKDVDFGRGIFVLVCNEPEGRPQPWACRELCPHLKVTKLLQETCAFGIGGRQETAAPSNVAVAPRLDPMNSALHHTRK